MNVPDSPKPGLLPPSTVPLPVPALQNGEQYWYDPPVMPQAGESPYWIMEQGLKRPIHYGSDWVRVPYGDMLVSRETIPSDERPKLFSQRKPPSRFNDLIGGPNSFTVSKRMLGILNDVDPDAFAWCNIEFEFKDGEILEDALAFIKVTRRIQCIDYANSRVMFRGSKGYPPYVARYRPVRFLDGIPSEYKIFADVTLIISPMFVTSEVKDRVEALRPKPNVMFRDPTEPLLPL